MEISLFSGYHFASNNVYNTGMSLNGIPFGLDVSLVQYGLNKKDFTDTYGKPRMALQARIIKMNNTDTFGYCLGILPSFYLPLSLQKKFQLSAKIAFGLNFNSQQYNFNTNFDNRAISFPVNFAMDAGLNLSYSFSPKLKLNIGSGLYHISNGSLKMPNGGINIIYGNAGVIYKPNGFNDELLQKPNYHLIKPGWHYMGYAAVGYKQMGYFSDLTSFWTATLSNQFYYSFNKLYSSGIGMDAFYDATQPLLNQFGLKVKDIPENQKYYLAAGIYNRFDIGKLFLPFGVYHYVYNMKYVQEPVYIRFGLGYQFHPKFFTGLFFKGTLNKKQQLQSDFMEWSVGIRI